jgi:hypothetical protein
VRTLVALLFASAVALPALALAAGQAPTAGTLTIPGIPGEGPGGSIPLLEVRGAPTSPAAYSPFVIRKRIDSSSPLIAQALTRNEVIEKMTLQVGGRTLTLQKVRFTSRQVDTATDWRSSASPGAGPPWRAAPPPWPGP